MGCPYCGGAVPPNRKFCCHAHQNRYAVLTHSRKKRGQPVDHCRNCGRVLMWHKKDYCSDECRKRSERPVYSMEGINALRFAALKQAKKEGRLRSWMKRPSFYELFPELTPDQLGGGKL